jgi:hypothetical protein
MRIAVLGYIVRGPVGGLAWHHLQYVRGLCDLGHDVLFLEDSDEYPACYDPSTDTSTADATYGLHFAAAAFSALGMANRWAYFDAHTTSWHGPAGGWAAAWCASADLLIDISGVNPIRPWVEGIPVRVLIDTDPAFTQIKALIDDDFRSRVEAHNCFFTFAENVADGTARLPDDGRQWHGTRQPVVTDRWPVTEGRRAGPFTTVMTWESYPALEHNGIVYGTKATSFDPFIDMPLVLPDQHFELAIGSGHAPRARLAEHGWHVIDPRPPTRDPWTYQAYLQSSKGEFGVAKHAYTSTWSGWFSERTACYLASGRPCVVQDTGFSDWLPVGKGLLAFVDRDEAVDAIQQVDRDYDRHCAMAREVAVDHFGASGVLSRLLDVAGGAG